MSQEHPSHKRLLEALPKVDLHRHLEGSLRMVTMLEVARSNGIGLPRDEAGLKPLVQVTPDEAYTWRNFLAKFDTLRKFFRSEETIRRAVREAIEDAARDKVCYLELRFTPAALASGADYPLSEVIDWVLESGSEASRATGTSVGYIPSVNRHEPVEVAELVVQAAVERRERGVVGVDLAGNEVDNSAQPFQAVFAAAQQAGLGVTIHAGEWAGPANVHQALDEMGAQRIAHGGRVLDDPRAVAKARERRTVFEVCLTSNVLSGSVERYELHPLRHMIEEGLQVTLNSDDPSICGVRLSDEYLVATDCLGFSLETLHGLILAAAQASFLPPPRRQALEDELLTALSFALP